MYPSGLHERSTAVFEQYSSVSHTALSMARGHRAAYTDTTTNNNNYYYNSNAFQRGGLYGWTSRLWSRSFRSVVPTVHAKFRLVRWALKNSVRNLLNMDRKKSTSLGALVLQTSVLALTIRYSRTETVTGPRYLTSTAVVMSELAKAVVCLYMVFYTSAGKTWDAVKDDLLDVKEALKTAIPSGLYTLQNNLQFIAVSHLDAATFQVTYQLKILTTAVFSVMFLRRQLDSLRWSALVILTAGVVLVQVPRSDDERGGNEEGGGVGRGSAGGGSSLIGLMAVLTMCLSSGFAGVYFEKILKASSQSLWAKNVQMAVFSVALGMLAVVLNDGQQVEQHGFFQGYNTLTVFIVMQQAFLGLIISLVMKYADNILKGFASAISIILTSFVSYIFLDDLQPSCSFLIGSIVVMSSVLLYNVDQHSHKRKPETVV